MTAVANTICCLENCLLSSILLKTGITCLNAAEHTKEKVTRYAQIFFGTVILGLGCFFFVDGLEVYLKTFSISLGGPATALLICVYSTIAVFAKDFFGRTFAALLIER